MSWKKNVFSCLMWAVYLVIVVTAMIFTCRVLCDTFGMAEYFEIIMPAGYLLFSGILVFALHRVLGDGSGGRREGLAWVEGIIVAALFAAGLFPRVMALGSGSFEVPGDSVYLELAYLSADGPGMPQFSHGAVHAYLWALRLCFMLLGNKAEAALWMQLVLQLSGVLFLYLAVRRMAGRFPAVVMAAFFMLSPYMAEKSLRLSPEMLYLAAFSLVLFLLSRGVKSVPGWGFWLAAGALCAGLSYLDVAGLLLLPLLLGVVVMQRQDAKGKTAAGLCASLAGFVLGALGCMFADMMCSGKALPGIIAAWGELYRWKELQLSVTLASFDTVWLILLILCLMTCGVFSFWCNRGTERFTVWSFCLCVAILMQFLGMFTDEMNGYIYIFFFSTILAGLGIGESMSARPEEVPEERASGRPDDLEVVDLEVVDLELTELDSDEPAGDEQDSDRRTGKERKGPGRAGRGRKHRQHGRAEWPDSEPGQEAGGLNQEQLPDSEAEQAADGLNQEQLPDSEAEQAAGGLNQEQLLDSETEQEADGLNQEQWPEVEPEQEADGPNQEQLPDSEAEQEAGELGQGGESGEEGKIVGEGRKISRTTEKTASISEAAKKETIGRNAAEPEEKPQEKRKIEFLENPLPLPKKHVKRVMDYKLDAKECSDYDVDVAEDDDFDL